MDFLLIYSIGGETSSRREFSHRPQPSSVDNRDLQNAGHESLSLFNELQYMQVAVLTECEARIVSSWSRHAESNTGEDEHKVVWSKCCHWSRNDVYNATYCEAPLATKSASIVLLSLLMKYTQNNTVTLHTLQKVHYPVYMQFTWAFSNSLMKWNGFINNYLCNFPSLVWLMLQIGDNKDFPVWKSQ